MSFGRERSDQFEEISMILALPQVLRLRLILFLRSIPHFLPSCFFTTFSFKATLLWKQSALNFLKAEYSLEIRI